MSRIAVGPGAGSLGGEPRDGDGGDDHEPDHKSGIPTLKGGPGERCP